MKQLSRTHAYVEVDCPDINWYLFIGMFCCHIDLHTSTVSCCHVTDVCMHFQLDMFYREYMMLFLFHRPGFCMLQLGNISGGIYNIRPSTFHHGNEGPFFLDISSSVQYTVTRL